MMISENYQEKNILLVDDCQLLCYSSFMIMERLRKEIETCEKSRYQICKETGIDKAAMSRIMQGGSCKAETADILLKYFGLTITKDKKKAR
jgi:hypothetical protein